MVEVLILNRGAFGWCIRKDGADYMQFSTRFQAIAYCRKMKWFYTADL